MQIESAHAAIVHEILKTVLPENIKVWTFGSRATNTAKKYSDLDLALEANDANKIAPDLIIKLELAFEESLLPWKVEIVDLNDISASFKAIIDSHKVLMNI